MARNNIIQNFPITASDITNDHTMFVPNLADTRGKKVQYNPDRLGMDYVAVPKDLLKLHKFVSLLVDVMFVNGTPFLITISRGIIFLIFKKTTNHTSEQLSKS